MPAGDDVDEKKRMFGAIDAFVKITIEGKAHEVPADMELLRCFQYLGFHIAFERFCWNASCENCMTNIRIPGKEMERTYCCQTMSEEGIEVETLPEGVDATKN